MTLTPKQEAFCLAYIETGNASEAYRRSYDVGATTKETSVHVSACKLLADVKIAQRVTELKADHVARHEVTVDTIRAMLLEDREFAREVESAGASVSATMGLAKLYGLLVDKQVHSGGVRIVSVSETDERI